MNKLLVLLICAVGGLVPSSMALAEDDFATACAAAAAQSGGPRAGDACGCLGEAVQGGADADQVLAIVRATRAAKREQLQAANAATRQGVMGCLRQGRDANGGPRPARGGAAGTAP